MANDKGSLLPSSTKASSDDSGDLNNSGLTSSGSLQMSARHLPPVYVDIQEEIEVNLDEIQRQSKYACPSTLTPDVPSEEPLETAHAAHQRLLFLRLPDPADQDGRTQSFHHHPHQRKRPKAERVESGGNARPVKRAE